MEILIDVFTVTGDDRDTQDGIGMREGAVGMAPVGHQHGIAGDDGLQTRGGGRAFECQLAPKTDPLSASNVGSDSILMQADVRFVLFSRRNQHDGSDTSVFPACPEGFCC